ncbi:HTTM domain-containing protein [Aeoliella sp. SH292]|uniref:HTTM domain-containing protein n=1 Tax=Aeoliella sp. SH292 TaxID=3454464 RepID=UPI003F98B7BF
MISAIRSGLAEYWGDAWEDWNEFWFTPVSPETLSAIRVFAGAMLFYTHFIWSFDLWAFMGPNGWLPLDFYGIERGYRDPGLPSFAWSLFQHVRSPLLLWSIHIVALITFFMLMIGLFSRWVAVLAAFFAIMYATRVTPGAYFGLDKINCMLAMYLMLGPCGARYSVDRLLRMRKGIVEVPRSWSANLALRLIQIHMCAIYLFAGLGKLEGNTWWTGEAIWLSVANTGYQSLPSTWIGHFPWMMDLLAHTTIFFELFYCVLIWPRFTRPWMLFLAVGMHLFIALCMGMITFGLAMLIGNLAFVYPSTVRKVMDPLARRMSLLVLGDKAVQGKPDAPRARGDSA